MGNVDTSRASRFILKDYVSGKLLYCHAPPDIPANVFNAELHDLDRLASLGKLRAKRAPMTRVPIKADTYIQQTGEEGAATALSKTRQSTRAKALDRNFFAATLLGRPAVRGVAGEKNGAEFSRVRMFPHQQGEVGNDGVTVVKKKKRTGKKEKATAALNGSLGAAGQDDDKKHFKPKRQKQRSGRGYEE